MKHCLLIPLLAFHLSTLSAQTDTIYGDLTADGVPEMLVTVDHPEPLVDTVEGYEILETATVYRRDEQGQWHPWSAATGFLMHAYDEVGMDRFYPTIERGALVLIHGKGGWLNWETTHRFRWQNDRFELIGYTHSFLDRCHESHRFDYNLSTGRWTFDQDFFNCDENDEQKPDGGTNEYREGIMPPKRVFTLGEESYLEFGPPEQ